MKSLILWLGLLGLIGYILKAMFIRSVFLLHGAAASGNISIVRRLLSQKKVDINSKNRGGWTPLILAASHGHSEIVELLLAQSGIDINVKDKDGHTALMFAAGGGHTAVVC